MLRSNVRAIGRFPTRRLRLPPHEAALPLHLALRGASPLAAAVVLVLRHGRDDRPRRRGPRHRADPAGDRPRRPGHARTPAAELECYLRALGRAALECRITLIRPDGRVVNDTDLLPAEVPPWRTTRNRPEVLRGPRNGYGTRAASRRPRASTASTSPGASRTGRAAPVGRRGPPARGRERISLADARRDRRSRACSSSRSGPPRRAASPIRSRELTEAASADRRRATSRGTFRTAGGEEVQLLGGGARSG